MIKVVPLSVARSLFFRTLSTSSSSTSSLSASSSRAAAKLSCRGRARHHASLRQGPSHSRHLLSSVPQLRGATSSTRAYIPSPSSSYSYASSSSSSLFRTASTSFSTPCGDDSRAHRPHPKLRPHLHRSSSSSFRVFATAATDAAEDNTVLASSLGGAGEEEAKEEAGGMATEMLAHTVDRYGGVIVDHESFPASEEEFATLLAASIASWITSGVRGVWLKIPSSRAELVGHAVHVGGFGFHHAEPTYVMLTRWLPEDEENHLPPNASHQVGIGAFIVNGKGEVLLVGRGEASHPATKGTKELIVSSTHEVYKMNSAANHYTTSFLSSARLTSPHLISPQLFVSLFLLTSAGIM